MSILRPFVLARTTLGVAPEADAAAIKRAYRKLVLAHPPDTDPEGFRRIRSAYELLTDPGARLQELLLQPEPAVDPPPLPAVPELPATVPLLPLVLLRLVATRVDSGALLAPAAPTKTARTAAPTLPTRPSRKDTAQ